MYFDRSYNPREGNTLYPEGYKEYLDYLRGSNMHGRYITEPTEEEMRSYFLNQEAERTERRIRESRCGGESSIIWNDVRIQDDDGSHRFIKMRRENGQMIYDNESPLVRGPLRGARQFDISGNKWKTVESFRPPLGVPCYIRWNGWESRVQDLIERDWVITKVTNHYTGKVKLYVRDPVTKLMGAGELMERQYESGLCRHFAVDLNYFCHEKNQRIKKFIQQVESEEIVRITEDNIGVVLEHISELQRKTAKPKKRKKVTEVEILQYRTAI